MEQPPKLYSRSILNLTKASSNDKVKMTLNRDDLALILRGTT